jgi:hypothetical protein
MAGVEQRKKKRKSTAVSRIVLIHASLDKQ